MTGLVRRAVADRDAHRPGRRRRARDGQLLGHPDRRLPEPGARARARRQRGRGHRGLVHGARAGRAARARSSWRLVFLVSVPFGIFGTVWAYWKLQERGERRPARIDWWGNATFAIGLILVLVSITYGIQPYGGHSMGWTNPLVLARDDLRARAARDLRRHRAAHRGPDVQPRAVPHPGLHRRQHRHAARLARPRRADVHADHLAAGHLAAAARLQLLGDAALGGHLHAAADGRIPGRRPGFGTALGSLRRAALRDRRHALRRARVPAARAAAGGLRLLGVRRRCCC